MTTMEDTQTEAPASGQENPEILGLLEMSALLHVGKRTPHAWAYRRLLPPPDYPSVNGLKAWNRSTIIKWAADTARLPEELRHEVPDARRRRGGAEAKAAAREALVAAGELDPDAEPRS